MRRKDRAAGRGDRQRDADRRDVRRPGHGVPPQEGYVHGRGTHDAARRQGGRARLRWLDRGAPHGRDAHYQARARYPPRGNGPRYPDDNGARRADRLRRERGVYAGVPRAVRISRQLLRKARSGDRDAARGPAQHRRGGQQGHRPAEAAARARRTRPGTCTSSAISRPRRPSREAATSS